MNFDTTMIESLGFVPGTMVSNYRIVQEISRGGMGVVYLALDLKTQQKVAIKVMLHSNFINDERASKRFLRESEVISSLEHPNIVHRYAMGIQGNVPYIVMQYVEGIPITEYAKQMNKNNWKLYAQLMYKLANALAYIHQNGIIHRDLKANNILVQADGEPVILDFGIAKILNAKGFNLTHDGEILGSINMSPEQAEGQNSKIDERSDIYSLGTIFYEILTGVSLVKNGSVLKVLKQIINNKPIAPHILNKKVPISLEKIVLKCLEKSPSRRFQHATILEEQLKAFLDRQSSNNKYSNNFLTQIQNNKIPIIIASALLILVLFIGIISKNKLSNNIKNIVPNYDKQTQQFFDYVNKSGFRFLGYQKYSCGSCSNVVAEFQQESTNMEFVLIPAGGFNIGLSPFFTNGKEISALPNTKMTISPFLIAKYECTQEIWKNVMGNLSGISATYPISSITLNECLEFCKRTKLSLPSEAQWEYACRAGSTTQFFWGNDDKELSQYIVSKKITSVGSKKPNAFGLYDIMGNVSEWCLDNFHRTYHSRPTNEIPWMEQGNNRVIRGSHIKDEDMNFHRSGIRREVSNNVSSETIGVRFVFLSEQNKMVWEKILSDVSEKKLDKISDKKIDENSSTEEKFQLGLMYLKQKNFEKARQYMELATNQGNIEAQNILGVIYYFGQGVPKDTQKARLLFEKAASKGHAVAQSNLGQIYQNGIGVQQDFEKAYYWFTRAASQGELNAQTFLGILYTVGKGVKRDFAKARLLFEKAANQGHAEAQFYLAHMYYQGQGVKQDFVKAHVWLEKAVNKEHAKAQNLLAIMYQKGKGVSVDPQKARFLFEKAANQGNVGAQYNLAMMYYKGQEIKADINNAIYWFKKAADQGDSDAQFQLGVIYNSGQGVAKDVQKAIYWFEKAANQDDVNAQFSLGTIYAQGEGNQQNLQKAYFWFEKAASKGHPVAQYNLAMMYLKRDGVAKNDEKARFWLEKASQQGFEAANQKLKELMQK